MGHSFRLECGVPGPEFKTLLKHHETKILSVGDLHEIQILEFGKIRTAAKRRATPRAPKVIDPEALRALTREAVVGLAVALVDGDAVDAVARGDRGSLRWQNQHN